MKKIHEVNVAMAGESCSLDDIFGSLEILFSDNVGAAFDCLISLIFDLISRIFPNVD